MSVSSGRSHAWRLILAIGIVSLFADMTYEASRSIIGPYLQLLGASATVVGLVAGAGELLGYGVRLLSGKLVESTRRYWPLTFLGYAVNLLAVPALALAPGWATAAILVVTERVGKGIRVVPRDAMLSHATSQVGHGKGYGFHEAMDQIGALVGPAIVFVVLSSGAGYRWAFGVLLAPALLSFAALAGARIAYPDPRDLEPRHQEPGSPAGMPPLFWLYLAAVGLVGLGMTDFALVAYHIKAQGVLADRWIPLLYAGAMGIDAVTALLLGWWYDRRGVRAMMAALLLTAAYPPLAFSTHAALVIAGVGLWGIGMGAVEGVARSVVAELLPPERRPSGFGIFNAVFGLAWFVGSLAFGFLYSRALPVVMAIGVVALLGAAVLLWRVRVARPAVSGGETS